MASTGGEETLPPAGQDPVKLLRPGRMARIWLGERSNQVAQDRRLAEHRCRAQPEHRGGGMIIRRKRAAEPERLGAVVISGNVTTRKPNSARDRLGALALGLSALLLTAFPLVRPFFPLDPRSPGETLAIASPSITSARWVVAHLLAMVAFVLLPFGMLALYAYLRAGLMEPRALRALSWSLAGIALIMPMLGFETYVLPVVGRLYLAGTTGIAPVVGEIYLGPAIAVFLLGLLFL